MTGGMVIIGGGMAGARAAIALRANGWQGPVTLVSREQSLPYDRPPLSKAVITAEPQPGPDYLLDEANAASLGVTVLLGEPADAIDRANRVVQAGDQRIAYDKLLIATGAHPRRLACPGAEHALILRNFSDAEDLRARFTPGARVAIIGGGFIGLELAASAAARGCRVTVSESLPRILMRGVPEEVARAVHDRHVAAGVVMLTGTGVNSLTAHSVELADGRSIPADVIVAGIGAVPEIAVAQHCGLAIDNGIAVDATLRTSDEHIYAAGDCCSFPHPVFGGKRLRLESWRNAQDQGTLAGENMLGANKTYAAVPWFWSDQHDLSLQIAGLPGEGTDIVRRNLANGAFLMFHRDAAGRLLGASGIGTGNAVARDIKLAEMLIARGLSPSPEQLADPAVSLKTLLKN